MTMVSAEDRGFTLGDGVFDTALAVNGVIFARERHVTRLIGAAHAIGIHVQVSAVQSALDVALDVARKPVDATLFATKCDILRTTVTRGIAARGLWPASAGEPTIVVTSTPWNPSLLGQPARLVIAGAPRNERSLTANLKTLGYLDHILAAREAATKGADDALILNTQGRVACTTIANIFFLKGNLLTTPPLSEGCLPGIIRALVLEIAPTLGLEVAEAPILLGQLIAADAVFLTNSVRFIRRVIALDGINLPSHDDEIPKLGDALFAHVKAECGVDLRDAE